MLLRISAVVTVLLFIALTILGAPLITDAAPAGIVSFELARTTASANHLLDSWDTVTRLHAAFSLGLDYLFMFAYGAFFVVASLKTGELLQRRSRRLAGAARPLAAGAVLAASLDALENVALLVILFQGRAVNPWPFVAWLCATVKFSLLGLASAYLLAGGGILLIARNFSRFSSYNG